MLMETRERNDVVEYTKAIYKKGDRIRLIQMKGESLPYGLLGTVDHVDSVGQIHVNWDNGSGLALILGEDGFVKL